MNKSNLAWLAAALALGLGSIYAVWAADDSGAAKHSAVAVQDKGSAPGASSDQPKDAVNINPFGK
ncbi:hypothetical protein BCF11_4025 [Collimonas sp. PA-H2]|uniref:hypothetical protein n=1 Tax=Collimonas sp. PA-H2 TaxID=1881062 RepID=UPI000BF93401|nr:hypothetical protein [Collimonas sp. PA-H2]PFH11573.1 hypothetical protein BCF11_4025 [Collimonas sp. PA-H2]